MAKSKSFFYRFKDREVEMPILLFLTIVGVKGYSMATGGPFYRGSATIDRDVVSLPEVIIEKYDEKAEKVLRPSFDAIWNACGFAESQNYDQKGNWAPKRY